MRDHLRQEHEQKLNIIDNVHSERMQNYSNERNRDNNHHAENMQRYSNERNRDNNTHTENMQRLSNDREDNLIKEVDMKFDKFFFNEEFIKEKEKLPNKIKLYLEKYREKIE